MSPGIYKCSHSKSQLPQPLYIKNFRNIIEEDVYRAKAVLDEVTGFYRIAQVPVVIKKALNRSKGNQRKAVKKKHLVHVQPLIDGKF